MLSVAKHKPLDSTNRNYSAAKFISFCKACVAALFLTIMLSTVVLVAASDSVDYFSRHQFILPHVCLAILGIALLLAISYFAVRFDELNNIVDKYCGLLVFLAQFSLFCIQVISAYEACFIGSWDSGGLFTAAWNITHDWSGLPGAPSGWNDYFTLEWLEQYSSMYPNNHFLLGLFCGLLSFCSAAGISDPSICILLLCVLNSAIVLISAQLLFLFLREQYGSVCAVIGWLLYFILIGMSAWFLVPYSDSLALLFPTLVLWLSSRLYSRRKPIRYAALFSIFLVSTIGYCLKPQCVFMLFAVLVVVGMSWIRRLISMSPAMRLFLSRIVATIVISICGIGLGLLAKGAFVGPVESDLNIDTNASFSPAHFLMMGLNDVSDGGFYADDVWFSESFSTNVERNHADMDRAFSRIREYGVWGMIDHLTKKQLVNWGDGSFAWGEEGGSAGFYSIIYRNESALYSDRIYGDISGVDSIYYAIYKCIIQIAWIAVLVGMLSIRLRNRTPYFWICMISILFLAIFELTFEARARYLYIYVPIMIALLVDNLWSRRAALCD